MKRPMMVTTTSISMRVTPAWEFLRRLSFCFMLYRHIVNARNREQHAEDERPYYDTHHQNHGRLEDGRESLDGGARIVFVNVGCAGEHAVQAAGLFADGQQMGDEGRKDSRLAHGPGDTFAALYSLRDAAERVRDAAV